MTISTTEDNDIYTENIKLTNAKKKKSSNVKMRADSNTFFASTIFLLLFNIFEVNTF